MGAEEVVTNANGDVDAIINELTGQARLSLQCVDVSIMEHAEYIRSGFGARGVMRVGNKLFWQGYLSIFDMSYNLHYVKYDCFVDWFTMY